MNEPEDCNDTRPPSNVFVPAVFESMMCGVAWASKAKGATTLHYTDGSTESAKITFDFDDPELTIFQVTSKTQDKARNG